jgi:hypothetical protein
VGTWTGAGNPGGGAFTGNFNGAGQVIRDLYIFRPSQNGVGLFAQNARAYIYDLGLEDVSITGEATAAPERHRPSRRRASSLISSA